MNTEAKHSGMLNRAHLELFLYSDHTLFLKALFTERMERKHRQACVNVQNELKRINFVAPFLYSSHASRKLWTQHTKVNIREISN